MMRSCKSPTTHNHAAYLCGRTPLVVLNTESKTQMQWPYTQKRREIQCHRREWRNHQNRNCGSTSICTTTTYLFFFFFFFYSLPNEDTRRASRDDAMVNKKEGEGGNKVPFGTFGNSRGFFFNRMLGSKEK